MDKKRIEIIITIILAVILVLSWANSFKFLKGRVGKKATTAVSDVSISSSTINKENAVHIATKAHNGESLEWARCPFSGKVYSDESSVSTLKLVGIVSDEKGVQAAINNELYRKGDRINNKYSVLDIQSDRVILSDGTKEFELRL